METGSNVVAVRSIEIVTAQICTIRDNVARVVMEGVVQIGRRLEEAMLAEDYASFLCAHLAPLVRIVSRQDVRILASQKCSLAFFQFEVDVVDLVRFVQTQRREHFAADVIPDPVPDRLIVLGHAALLQQVLVQPFIALRSCLLLSVR